MADPVKNSDDAYASLLDSVTKLATPFAQAFALGSGKNGDEALQENRNKYNVLNGSGANNPALASSQSPKGLFDFLFGGSETRNVDTSAPSNQGVLLMLVLVIGLTAYVWFRR